VECSITQGMWDAAVFHSIRPFLAILNRCYSVMPNSLLRIYRPHATQSAGQPGYM
jgi:hypothetical protein